MVKYHVVAGTDITGFGLLGHALKMAKSSGVGFIIDSSKVPVLEQAEELVEMGCIPGAAFRNQDFAEPDCFFEDPVIYNRKMLLMDAQTSGGLLFCCSCNSVSSLITELKEAGYPETKVIGMVTPPGRKSILVK